jgi:2-polyprenyl-3-methyl-5-hydroxy-6-metoxy-1,4-benzoquinol methylase
MAAIPHEAAHSRCDRHASCPICASRGHWSFDSRFVQVHQCENEQCAHLFAVNVDSNHGVMHAVHTDAAESMYAERNERLVAFWEDRRFVTGNSRLLDVGAGTGHLARSVRRRLPGIEILCVEESEPLRNRLGHQGLTVSKNLEPISSDRSFDAVLLIEVIEHVPDPVDFLDRLRKCLDPKGRMFLTTPCGELRNGSRATNAYDTPEHVQFFTEKSLRLAVKKAGFRDITYEYIEALYPRSTSALSLATYKRLALQIVRPIMARLQGPRHLTGFIDP